MQDRLAKTRIGTRQVCTIGFILLIVMADIIMCCQDRSQRFALSRLHLSLISSQVVVIARRIGQSDRPCVQGLLSLLLYVCFVFLSAVRDVASWSDVASGGGVLGFLDSSPEMMVLICSPVYFLLVTLPYAIESTAWHQLLPRSIMSWLLVLALLSTLMALFVQVPYRGTYLAFVVTAIVQWGLVEGKLLFYVLNASIPFVALEWLSYCSKRRWISLTFFCICTGAVSLLWVLALLWWRSVSLSVYFDDLYMLRTFARFLGIAWLSIAVYAAIVRLSMELPSSRHATQTVQATD